MRPRNLLWPLQPSPLLCIVLALTPVVQASLGDRQPEFRSCVAVSSRKSTMDLSASRCLDSSADDVIGLHQCELWRRRTLHSYEHTHQCANDNMN